MKEGGRGEHGMSEGSNGVVGREGGRKGREGGSFTGIFIHRRMPVVVTIHSTLTCWWEGLGAVRGRERARGAREGGRFQLLLIHNAIKITCLLSLKSTLHRSTCWQKEK